MSKLHGVRRSGLAINRQKIDGIDPPKGSLTSKKLKHTDPAMKTKQHPIVPTLRDKNFIQALKEEFELKNDGEALQVIVEVAMTHRFTPDGIDLFEVESKAIHNGRAASKTAAKIERLKAMIAEMEAAKANA
jgi:hypothetical protein